MYKIIALSVLLATQASFAAKFESSQLGGATKSDDNMFETSKNSAKATQKAGRGSVEKAQADLNALYNQLNALNLISKSNPKQANSKDLLMRRANLNVQIAKLLGLNTQSAAQMTERERFHLDQARQALARLEPQVPAKGPEMATVLYLKGQIENQYDRPDIMIEYFVNSLQMDSASKQAASMSLIVAEASFEKDKFEEAIQYYQRPYKIYDDYQKTLADYKTAWCYLSLKKYEQAEYFFMKVVRQKVEPNFAEDSLKDLAYVVIQKRNDEEIIGFANKYFPMPEQKAKFLYFVLNHAFGANKKNVRYNIFNEVLKIQQNPIEKFKTYALLIRFERKEYPSVTTDRAIRMFNGHLKMMRAQDIQFALSKDTHLEDDSEFIIRVFADGFVGKIKSPENITKEDLGKSLKEFLRFHSITFPASKKMEILYSLWIDVCADSGDGPCLDGLKKDLLMRKDPKMNAMAQKALGELVSFLDKAYEKEPAKNEGLLLNYINEYFSLFPNDANIPALRKRIAAVHLKKERYRDAFPHLKAAFDKEPNAENLYKVWLCLFNMGDFNAIAQSIDDMNFKDPKLMELKREASLKLAMKGMESGDFAAYETHLKQFIASKPEPQKAIVAYVDYFNKILDKRDYAKFSAEWEQLDPKMAAAAEFNPIRMRNLQNLILDGDFSQKPPPMGPASDKDLNYQILIYKTAVGQKPTDADYKLLDQVGEGKKNYYLGLLALTDQDAALAYFAKQKKWGEFEKKMVFLAITLKKGSMDFSFAPEDFKKLAGVVPDRMAPVIETKTEIKLKGLVFPDASMNATKYNKTVEGLVDGVRATRALWNKDFGALNMYRQLSILARLIEAERKSGDFLRNSPPPPGLSDAQKVEYQRGLSELSTEFERQSAEYQKIFDELEKRRVYQEDQDKLKELPEIDINAWGWTQDRIVGRAKELAGLGNHFAALLFMDAHLGAKNLPPNLYYRGRTGVLLMLNGSRPMRRYVRDELDAAGEPAKEILVNWPGGFK